LISGIADRKRRAWRHRPIEAGCEIVEHHNALSSIEERVDHVAAEIAGAAGDEDCHAVGYLLRMNETAADQSLISEILEPFCVHGTSAWRGKVETREQVHRQVLTF